MSPRVALAAVLLLVGAPAQAAAPITGRWLTENGEAVVQIAPCGPALCGRVVAVLKAPPGAKSAIGTMVLSNLVADGELWRGQLFDPRSGKGYKARVRRNPDGTLKVEGCVAFLCRGPVWRPAP